MTDDSKLLRAYAEMKSEMDFAEFVRRRIGFVHGTAMRQVSGDAQMAEDVTQTVFVLVAKKAEELSRSEHIAGWLHTTTSHVARRAWRDARRRDAREQKAVFMSEINRDEEPVQFVDEQILRKSLDDALGELHKSEREAVILRFFEGRAFAEIGAVLRTSEDGARMRVTRAMEKMRSMLAKKGVSSSAAALGALMTSEAAHAAPAGLAAAVATASAGGAAAASAGATILAFMSTAKMIVITGVALALAMGSAWYCLQSERAALESLNIAQRENAALVAKQRESEQIESARNAAARSGTLAKVPDPVAAGAEFLAVYPSVLEVNAASGRALAAQNYYRLYRELGWSREKWDEFCRLQGPFYTGVSMVYTVRPTMPDMVSMQIPLGEGHSVLREKLKALLGEADFAIYSQEADYWIERKTSQRVASALYFSDTPLAGEQGAKLYALLTTGVAAENGKRRTSDDWDMIINQARAFLTDDQIHVIETEKTREELAQARAQFNKSRDRK